MAKLHSYLFFDGNCAEAMRSYEKILGGKLTVMKAGDAPASENTSPEAADKVLHASLDLGDGDRLLASDWMAPTPFEPMQGFSLSFTAASKTEAQRVFDALAEGGQVRMPLEKTFWSEAFGMLVDRYGTPWMVGIDH